MKRFLKVFFVFATLCVAAVSVGCGGNFSTRSAPTPVETNPEAAAQALETAKILAANISSMSCSRSLYSGNELNGFGGEDTCKRARFAEAAGTVGPDGKVILGGPAEWGGSVQSGDPREIARLKRRYLP